MDYFYIFQTYPHFKEEMSSYSRTSRTVKVTTGPDGTRTETTTITGPDGTRTETRVIGGSGGGGSDFTNGMNGGFKSGFSSKVTPRTSSLNDSKYKRGWSSRSVKPTGPPMKLEGKTFTEIRDQCLKEGRLFEDPDFLAVDSSIFFSRSPPRPFVWKRPPVSIS